MAQSRRGLCLADEPRFDRFVECEFRRKDLDRDLSAELQIGAPIDDSRPSATDLTVDQVLRPDGDGYTVEQVVGHDLGRRAGKRAVGREPPDLIGRGKGVIDAGREGQRFIR